MPKNSKPFFKIDRYLRKKIIYRILVIFRRLMDFINITKYDTKGKVLFFFRIFRVIAVLLSIGIFIYYYGFNLSHSEKEFAMLFVRPIFIFFFLNYVTNLIFEFNIKLFLKNNWLEGAFLALLMLHGFYSYFYTHLNLPNIYIQILLLIIIFIEVGKAASKLPELHIGPASLLILSFVFLILSGAGLLMLPEMTSAKISMPFLDALFTSTSASCVTGLIVVDTPNYFSLKGQLIVLILIQTGGLSIISFATFFAVFVKQTQGLKQQSILTAFLSSENLLETKSLLKRIVLFSIGFETIGAILIFFLWNPELNFSSWGERIYYSIFHSISAFNNAGFALFTDNLNDPLVRNSYFLHLVIAALIVIGGLGFAVLDDLFSIESLRLRLKFPWKQLKVNTKIVLNTTIALIIVGTVVFYLTERNNTLQGLGTFEALVKSLFHSISPRTAGFNTLDYASMGRPIIFFTMMLMFIGASSGSTGGGIKTSTFTIILFTVWSTIRGKKNVDLLKTNISIDLFKRAFSIFFFSLAVIFIGTFILLISEPQFNLIQLLFEEISAFGTVGLSTGITSNLSEIGKSVIICTMFIGRVGILTLAFALTTKTLSTNYLYPKANVMVG